VSWFDEQIRQRKKEDQESFEDSIFRMASAVMGGRGGGELKDSRIVTKDAIDEILKYFHRKPADIPDSITDPAEQLEYALRPHGLMYRRAELSEKWYKNAYGPMIAYRRDNGMPAAVLPGSAGGYWFGDGALRVQVNSKTAKLFDTDAICFYRPLPLKKIGIQDLLKFMKDCLTAGDYVFIILISLIATLVGFMMPYLRAFMTGFVAQSGSNALLWGTMLFMVCAAVSTQLISASKTLMISRIQTKTELAVESAMMMRLMSLPPPFFRKYSSGELSSRAQSVNRLCDLLLGMVFSMGITSVMSLLYIGQIFGFAPALAIPAVIIIAATVAVTLITTLMQMRLTRRHMEHSAKESGLTYAIITGLQKIKLAGAEKRIFARWAERYAEGAEILYGPPIMLRIVPAITLAISLAGNLVLYFLAVQSEVSPSDYIGFNASFGMISGAFGSLAGVATTVAEIRPILELAEPVLKAVPENQEHRQTVTSLSGGIELNNVYFRYNESTPYIIDGMDLKIRAGEYVAIVGKTGCGKSTLMRLLLGFEKPEKGAIYYDGRDIGMLDLRSLRRGIGAVTQDGSLFQGDIYSNIVISAPQLTLDEAWEAAETAGIADDIRAMPMGMNTVIGEGQGGISGGQKQRLMIARAIAPKPKILMFDEATSALDNMTQRKVSEALDRLKCTRLIIAHRLSTIKNCDRILVLDKGKIIEDGTYDELIAKNGYFAELVERQRLDDFSGAN